MVGPSGFERSRGSSYYCCIPLVTADECAWDNAGTTQNQGASLFLTGIRQDNILSCGTGSLLGSSDLAVEMIINSPVRYSPENGNPDVSSRFTYQSRHSGLPSFMRFTFHALSHFFICFSLCMAAQDLCCMARVQLDIMYSVNQGSNVLSCLQKDGKFLSRNAFILPIMLCLFSSRDRVLPSI